MRKPKSKASPPNRTSSAKKPILRKHSIPAVKSLYSNDFLSAIIDAMTEPVFVKDRSHRWVVLNEACCRIIGHSRQDLIGKSDYDFFSKAEADVFWAKD